MGSTRTAWHVIFAALLDERAPPGIDVITEVTLSEASMMRWDLSDLGGEYWRVEGSDYPSFLVVIDEVAA